MIRLVSIYVEDHGFHELETKPMHQMSPRYPRSCSFHWVGRLFECADLYKFPTRHCGSISACHDMSES